MIGSKPETNTIADRLEAIASRCSYEDDRVALTAAAEAIRQYFTPAQSKLIDPIHNAATRGAARDAAEAHKSMLPLPPQESVTLQSLWDAIHARDANITAFIKALDVEEKYLLGHFDADCDIMPGDVEGSFHRIRELPQRPTAVALAVDSHSQEGTD
jgi:hypothetical protein